ncbi:MAG: CTP-dependent riboflavin kinase [Nanoarchaeota archaeon]|nr:CTP-dependent riboflavin kinase [Nanoarchaeota archaeon]
MISDFDVLLKLAEENNLKNKNTVTTIGLSKSLTVSQQTISRKLIELEKAGLIVRNSSYRGITFSLTEDGTKFLNEKFIKLRNVLTKTTRNSIEGEIVSGLGEGKYYVSQKEYMLEFKKKLGFEPYAGTLNMNVNEMELAEFLSNIQMVVINGFKKSERTYGEIYSYPVRINKELEGAIIIPKRTSHSRKIVEVIAPVFLRGTLKLTFGDTIELIGKK